MIPKYRRMMESVCSTMNKAFNRNNLPLVANTSACTGINVESHLWAEYHIRNYEKTTSHAGVFHANQINSFADILAKYVNFPHDNINGIGAVQSGKTGIVNSLYTFLGVCVELLTGEKTLVITIIPNRKNFKIQSDDEFMPFFTFNKNITIQHKATRKKVLVKEYHSYMEDFFPMHGIIHDKFRFMKSPKIYSHISTVANMAHAQNYHVVSVVDEHHYATGNESIHKNIMEKLNTHQKDKHRTIGLSATGWQSSQLWQPVHCYLGEGYCGFNFFNGVIIDPSAKTTLPHIITHNELAKMTNTPTYSDINRNKYENIIGKMETGLVDNHHYPQQCAFALKKVIEWLLFTHNPANGKGICLRFLNNNNKMRAFFHKMNLSDKIDVIEFMDNNLQDSLKNIIASRKNTHKPYIVVVTGSGRMADSFPADCTYFIDFTARYSTMTSGVQGLPGRACGYNKNSWLILTDDGKFDIEEYIRTKGQPSSNVAHHQTYQNCIPTKRRGRPNSAIYLTPAAIDIIPELKTPFTNLRIKIQEILDNCKVGRRKKIVKSDEESILSPRVQGGYCPMFSQYFSEKYLKLIEKNHKLLFPNKFANDIQLLRPGELDSLNKQYLAHKDNPSLISFGIRETGRGAGVYQHMQKNDRDIMGGSKSTYQGYSVQVHIAITKWDKNVNIFRFHPGTWVDGRPICEIVTVKLRLKNPVCNTGGGYDTPITVHPSEKSYYYEEYQEDNPEIVFDLSF